MRRAARRRPGLERRCRPSRCGGRRWSRESAMERALGALTTRPATGADAGGRGVRRRRRRRAAPPSSSSTSTSGFTEPRRRSRATLDDASTHRRCSARHGVRVPVVLHHGRLRRRGRGRGGGVPAQSARIAARAREHWVEIDPRSGRLASEPILAKALASAFFGTPSRDARAPRHARRLPARRPPAASARPPSTAMSTASRRSCHESASAIAHLVLTNRHWRTSKAATETCVASKR